MFAGSAIANALFYLTPFDPPRRYSIFGFVFRISLSASVRPNRRRAGFMPKGALTNDDVLQMCVPWYPICQERAWLIPLHGMHSRLSTTGHAGSGIDGCSGEAGGSGD